MSIEDEYMRSLQVGSHEMWLTPPARFLFTRMWSFWLRDFWLDMGWRWHTKTWRPTVIDEL